MNNIHHVSGQRYTPKQTSPSLRSAHRPRLRPQLKPPSRERQHVKAHKMSLPRSLRFCCSGSTQDLCIPGDDGALGSAAATLTVGGGHRRAYDWICGVREMTGGVRPTPGRASIMAVVLALNHALTMIQRALHDQAACLQQVDGNRDNSRPARPKIEIRMLSDSNYAIQGLRHWVPRWRENGSLGPIADPDLWSDIMDVLGDLDNLADVKYVYALAYQAEVKTAHQACRGNIEEQFQALARIVPSRD